MDGKIKIPDGMLEAALKSAGPDNSNYIRAAAVLEAALEWLSENPISPPLTELQILLPFVSIHANETSVQSLLRKFQQRMFLEPNEEIPEEIENLIWGEWQKSRGLPEVLNGWATIDSHNAQVLEAYRRGKAAR